MSDLPAFIPRCEHGKPSPFYTCPVCMELAEAQHDTYRTDVEPVLRAAERVKSTGMSDSTNDNDMDACVDCGYLPPSDEFYAVLGDLYAAVSASRVCQRIAEEGK